ncbi:M1 aminopeptidase family protein [Planctomonas psychrotolerans]|uniref:hypothetical protein n=1 Tax=Planctomonas psychrotolerans TaxID=2528712 RepID=UPI00123B1070|nr:hypothetical protein [Planctomonas psychrotolerans]
MSEDRIYDVTVSQDGGNYIIEVPRLGGSTETRDPAAIEKVARRYIAGMTDEDIDLVSVRVIRAPSSVTLADVVARTTLAAVPFVGGSIEVVYSAVRERRTRKAAQTVEEIVRVTGEQEFVRRLASDPRLEALFVNAVDSALRTGLEAKRRLLAQSVAAAAQAESAFDENELIAEALSQLDVQHVRALARLSDEWEYMQSASRAETYRARMGASDAWEAVPPPVQAALVRTGAATPSPTSYLMTDVPHRAEGITDFGLKLLKRLREEGVGY